MRNRFGWKLFLKVRQTTLGPLHTFQGAVRVEAGQGKSGLAGLLDEAKCLAHHSSRTDAILDAMDLSQVVLAAIDAALFAVDPPERTSR